MGNIFDDILNGGKSTPANGATEITSQRIADAVELIAAVVAADFYFDSDTEMPQSAAYKRFAALVQTMATKFAKRHGA